MRTGREVGGERRSEGNASSGTGRPPRRAWRAGLAVGLAATMILLFSVALRAQIGAEPPRLHGVRVAGTNLQIDASGAGFKRHELRVSSNLVDWAPAQDVLNSDTNFGFAPGLPSVPAFYLVLMHPGTNQPYWPGGSALSVGAGLTGTAAIAWPEATGPIAPNRYSLYRDGVLVANLPAGTTNYLDAGLDHAGDYTYSLLAHNALEDWTEPALLRTASLSPLPPDPAASVPAIEPGAVSLLPLVTDFLYTGPNAVQTGVDTGRIDKTRYAILRGRTLDLEGRGLPWVEVTVLDHPELGRTMSRTDGEYDLAVNGGAALSVNFQRPGYLPLQRTVEVPVQQYVPLDDVVLRSADTNRTVNNVAAPTAMEVARGGVVADTDGARRVVVMIPSGTVAAVFTQAGATQAISQLTSRFTEYTVGSNGPAAMPADLPPTVAYTYCVEMGSDEAQRKVAGKDVLFNRPVYMYVDNFLGIPTGEQVPVAYYDKDKAAWIPSNDGKVIELKGTNGLGQALIDVTGDGVADDDSTLAALGFTAEERLRLAAEYSLTQTLWRVAITHYSTYDCNYGIIPPATLAVISANPSCDRPPELNEPTKSPNNYGQVELENMAFREAIPVAGTPFGLHYSSAQMRGSSSLRIRLSDARLTPAVASVMKRIELEVVVAGRIFKQSFAPAPDLFYDFQWDGRDLYGRTLLGEQPVSVTVIYVYQMYYARPGDPLVSFGTASGQPMSRYVPARQEHRVATTMTSTIGYSPIRTLGFGGWSLTPHHVYDPTAGTLYRGDGTTLRARNLNLGPIVRTIAGNFTGTPSGDGGPASQAGFAGVNGLAIGPDGSIYVVEATGVRRITPDGIIHRAAGVASGNGFSGDGGPAIGAQMRYPKGAAVSSRGELYVADSGNHRIRRVDTQGIITTIAGDGTAPGSGVSPQGIRATSVPMPTPTGVDVAPDGSLYIENASCIWRMTTDGICQNVRSNVYGDGWPLQIPLEGTPACWSSHAKENGEPQLHVAASGLPYFVEPNDVVIYQSTIRSITAAGLIHNIAGSEIGWPSWDGDGGPATNAHLGTAIDVVCDSDGSYFICQIDGKVRQVTPDGIIRAYAGYGSESDPRKNDNGPAIRANLSGIGAMAFGRDGTLYFLDRANNLVRKIVPFSQALSFANIEVPSEDGAEIYEFTSNGRHLRTRDALTGDVLFSFDYTNGYLVGITDVDGKRTVIERDPADPARATAIVASQGQRTVLSYGADALLASVQDPAGHATSMTYTSNGLFSAITGPRGFTYTVDHDAQGRVVRASDPAGGFTALGASQVSNVFAVAHTSAVGRAGAVAIQSLSTGDRRRTERRPDGTESSVFETQAGVETNFAPNGVVAIRRQGPHPRFGMQSPIIENAKIRMPSGLTATISNFVGVGMSGDTLASQTNVTVINGAVQMSIFMASNRLVTTVSPEGRRSSTWLDAKGRISRIEVPGLEPVTYGYDEWGHMTAATQGVGAAARTLSVRFTGEGHLDRTVDALGRTNRFETDALGMVTNLIRPDGACIGAAFDSEQNLLSVTPPGRPAHTFDYSTVNMRTAYHPPVAGGGSNGIAFAYDADREVTGIAWAAGPVVSNLYDAAGRLASIVIPDGTHSFTYRSNGMPAAAASPDGISVAYAYDGGLVATQTWSGPVAGAVRFAYDSNFAVTGLTINAESPIRYTYDNDGLLTGAGGCSFVRSPSNGLFLSSQLGGVTDACQYNAFGEVTNYRALYNSTELFRCGYVYDNLGRIARKVETVEGIACTYDYTYDTVGRLIEVRTNGVLARTYGYDANGNRTNCVEGGSAVAGVYDEQDKLLAYGAAVYAHNARGDVTNRTVGGQTTAYAYDALGSLREVRLADSTQIEYLRDGAGRRAAKKINGTVTKAFLYASPLSPVAELDGSNNVVSVFVFAGGSTPAAMICGGTLYCIISDHLGSPRLVVDAATGAVAQRMDYDEFGRVTLDTNPGFQPFGYAGGLYDPDTGCVRFGVRDFDPETGRWLGRDPILFQGGGANLYAYVLNDPVNFVDRSGTGPRVSELIRSGHVIVSGEVGAGSSSVRVNRNGGRVHGADGELLGSQAELRKSPQEELAELRSKAKLSQAEFAELRKLAQVEVQESLQAYQSRGPLQKLRDFIQGGHFPVSGFPRYYDGVPDVSSGGTGDDL